MSIIKIATLSLNGITARTRVGMLADFIRRHDFGIIFAQEVTSTEVLNFRGYNTHTQTSGLSYAERSFYRGALCILPTELLCPQDEQ
jgi:hypothetical protein